MTLTADQQSAQSYINNSASGQGGVDQYVAGQTAKYNTALAMNDTHMLDALAADSKRTGLSYTPTVTQPTTNVSYPGQQTIPMGPPVPGSNQVVSHTATPVTTPATTNNVPFIQPDGSTGYRPATPPSGGTTPFTQIVPGYSTPVGPPAPVTSPATGTSNPTGQMDGTLHLNVNGQSGTDIPVFKGTSFESGSDLAKQLGLDYKADPKTGEVTIGGTKVMPTSYDKQGNAMVGVRQVANALGYQIGYDDKTKTVTITGENKTPVDPVQPWQAPDSSGLNGQMMPYGTFNGDMNSYYTQAHNQLDAQYQQQKQALLDKQDQDIKASDESMNRRGIYTSGVAQSVEDDLRTKTTQAVANVLSNQMAAVAKQAQSLYDTAYKQYMDGNEFALKNNQAVISNMLAVEKQSFNEYIQTHKLTDAETNAANAEFDKQADRIQRMTIAQLPYQNQTANNVADNQTRADIALLPYQQMTIYQQMTTQEKAQMDQATNYFKQQGINVDYAKLAESIRHNSTTETETASHNDATEKNATQVTTQNALKEKNANLYNIWKATGKAPAGIDQVAEGTPFVQSSSSSSADKNGMESTYIGNLNAMAPANRDKFFKEQQAAIVNDLGMTGYNTLHDMYYDFNGKIKS